MKRSRYIAMVMAITVLLTMLFSVTGCSLVSKVSSVAKIFVSAENGNDENDGLTAETAVATLEKAIPLVTDTYTAAKIVVIGTYQAETLPTHTAPVVITGEGSGTLLFTKDLFLGGPTTFENIGLGAAKSCYLTTDAHALTVANDVTAAGEGVLNLHIGSNDADCGKTYAYIGGGAYGMVHVGVSNNTDHRAVAGSYVELQGGTIDTLRYGTRWNGTNRYHTDFTEPVNLVIGAATIQKEFVFSTYELIPVFRNGFQVLHNNGTAGDITLQKPVVTCAWDGKAWIMNSESYEDCYLTPTDTLGAYTVHGGMEALAMDESDYNKEYRSVNGVLTVPPGTYTVMFDQSFETEYGHYGDRIIGFDECTIDLSEQPHKEKANHLFLGWVDKDGNAVPNEVTLEAGDVLTASYLEYSEADLTTPEPSVVLELGEPTVGFTLSYSETLLQKLPTKSAVFGGLWIPSISLNANMWADLTHGYEFVYKDTTYTATDSVATAREHKMSVSCSGIEDYNTAYTARGYLCYTDLNGNDQYGYSAPATTTLYALAKNTAPTDDDQKALYEFIVEKAKEYAKETFSETTPLADIPVGPNGTAYTVTNGNFIVREHTFDSGKGGEAVEIVRLTDVHYNYVNDEDKAENNPALISTRNYRSWLRNGESAARVRPTLQYAALADQLIVTGDVLDYLSRGALEIAHKEIWDLYPDAFLCNGNHDYVQVMEGKMGEVLSFEERYQMLRDGWEHDPLYTSRVLKDKVMVIQMDNGQCKNLDGQVEKLTADLKLAREKGYVVLLFMHIPLEEEKDSTASEVQERYRLITQNADVIKGIFVGHTHKDQYAEIEATLPDGTKTTIPQYTAATFGVSRIIVK